ncbi:MAG: tryptophan synthase subunit alpha [Phycisphaerae bacterium]|nr:tryptophan synthase subunit alpha [Phycisphaerae bacterium]
MNDLKNNRLVRTFAELRAAGKKTLLPFITAGYPDLETTEALLKDFESRGAVVCELGIPFSDPIADGPVIQASYTEALAAGVDCKAIFDMVRRYRSGGGRLALVAMVSYSIIYRHGAEKYLAAASEAGFDGVIVPDLSLEEAGQFERLAAACGLANIMLIAPTTLLERRLEIARHSRGFIYFISVAGITGERDRLPDESIAAVAELRRHTDTPVCVGFGISNAATVEAVCKVADGAIVGSAIMHRIEDAKAASSPREKIVSKIGDFVSELLGPLK